MHFLSYCDTVKDMAVGFSRQNPAFSPSADGVTSGIANLRMAEGFESYKSYKG